MRRCATTRLGRRPVFGTEAEYLPQISQIVTDSEEAKGRVFQFVGIVLNKDIASFPLRTTETSLLDSAILPCIICVNLRNLRINIFILLLDPRKEPQSIFHRFHRLSQIQRKRTEDSFCSSESFGTRTLLRSRYIRERSRRGSRSHFGRAASDQH